MESTTLPSSHEELQQLDKSDLCQILGQVCMKLYEKMGRKDYERIVIRQVLYVRNGIENFREFVQWTIDLLNRLQHPNVVAMSR